MSINLCALSGQLLINPVISKKTGHVYEKELILKHIETTAQCPITGQEMSKEDLVEIQNQSDNLIIKSRSVSSGNVKDVLHKIQSEWDTLLLENFQIKKQLSEIKQEIAHNLYQHEASNLVVCRLIKERDEALSQLNQLRIQVESAAKEEAELLQNEEEFDFMGIYDDLVTRINEISADLISNRKKRVVSPDLKTVQELQKFKVKGSYPIHSSSKPGITCLDVKGDLIITGGVDARAVLFDVNRESTLFTAEKHNKRINEVKFYPGDDQLAFAVCSSDNNASFWISDDNYSQMFKETYRITNHKAAVTSVSFHPLGEYSLFSSRDSFWSFHNLFKGVCLTRIQTETEKEITKCQFHPDGLIFATGESQGLVQIWDLATQISVLSLEAHQTEITAISFSENGFFLATSAVKDNLVNIIDLRKSQILKKIQLPEKYEVKSVKFDSSGSYLGIVGTNVSLYNVKNGNIFTEFNEHTDLVTDIGFGKNCNFIATTSLDRNLKIFD